MQDRNEIAKLIERAKEDLGLLMDIALRVRETHVQKSAMFWLLAAQGNIEYEHGYINALHKNNLANEKDFKEILNISIMCDKLCELIRDKECDITEFFSGWLCLKCGKHIPLFDAPKKACVGEPRLDPECKGKLTPLPMRDWIIRKRGWMMR